MLRKQSSRRVPRRKSPRRVTRRKQTKKRVRRQSPRRVTRRKQTKKRVTRRKTYPNIKRKGSYPAIFVINLRRDPDKWSKYKDDSRFIRYSACNGVEMSQANPYYDKLKIMWNAGDRKRKCTAGILNSHMSIIKMIADKKVNQALIVEDDVVIDFKELKKLNLNKLPQDSLIYFGGVLHPPTSFKDTSWKYERAKQTLKKGINRIQSDKYRVFGGFGYYFPRWEIAKQLYDIFSKKEKLKPLDTEMTYLQKKGIIKYLYYPALSYLHMEDAEKGVHGKSFIKRDMKHYG